MSEPIVINVQEVRPIAINVAVPDVGLSLFHNLPREYPDGPDQLYKDGDSICVSAPSILSGDVLQVHGRFYPLYPINYG